MSEPFRFNVKQKCNVGNEVIERNIRMNALMNYPKVKWEVATRMPCAVVGGGFSLKSKIDDLRDWPGDVFAINDTAAYLSENGIASYLFMIDANDDNIKTGPLIKGAVLATRCNPKNFIYRDIRIYDMLEDNHRGGVEGGPTAACRAPHLFLRMGYTAIFFFGCDGNFLTDTHITGNHKEALDNMLVIRAGGMDYLTNLALFSQCTYLAERIRRHPKYLYNCSEGLLRAILDYYDTWSVVGVSEDVKNQFTPDCQEAFSKEYQTNKNKVYQPTA